MSSKIVLFSGGVDSASLLALCLEQATDVEALFVEYGQRIASRPTASARCLVQRFVMRVIESRLGVRKRAPDEHVEQIVPARVAVL